MAAACQATRWRCVLSICCSCSSLPHSLGSVLQPTLFIFHQARPTNPQQKGSWQEGPGRGSAYTRIIPGYPSQPLQRGLRQPSTAWVSPRASSGHGYLQPQSSLLSLEAGSLGTRDSWVARCWSPQEGHELRADSKVTEQLDGSCFLALSALPLSPGGPLHQHLQTSPSLDTCVQACDKKGPPWVHHMGCDLSGFLQELSSSLGTHQLLGYGDHHILHGLGQEGLAGGKQGP